jgi:hypothetical protein
VAALEQLRAVVTRRQTGQPGTVLMEKPSEAINRTQSSARWRILMPLIPHEYPSLPPVMTFSDLI